MYGTIRAGDGWRARIGIVIPSINWSTEPWFYRTAPAGVTFHFGRMAMASDVTPGSLDDMRKHEVEACRLVADCEPDVIMYACTASTIVRGRGADAELMAELTAATGVPVCTTTEAIVRACAELGMRQISLGSPYTEDLDELERTFFEEAGLKVLNSTSLGIRDGRELADPSAGEVYRLGRRTWHDGSDGLVMTCLAMRAHECVRELEADLQAPVVTSAQATLWAGLRLAGVLDDLPELGRLMSRTGSGWEELAG
jgi:maleate isomerase